jgi:hypothetical protein
MKWLAIIVIGMSLLAGCQSPDYIPTAGGEADKTPANARSVYGRVAVSDRMGERSWEGVSCGEKLIFHCPEVFRVIVMASDGEFLTRHMLKGDGSFAWSLPPGEYMIVAMEYEKWDGGRAHPVTGRVGASFVVPEEPIPVYIGTLAIFLKAGGFRTMVRDDFEDAATASRLPQGVAKARMAKRLLTLERVSDGRELVDICNARWDLKCSKENHGVVPLTPASEKQEFRSVDSLTPSFSWQPSPREGVTYDIVIYRALPYGDSYVPGPIVEWAADLPEPRYILKKPLASGSNYFWSVRLRDSEVLSDWSTTSFHSFYFLVFVYGTETGRGILFNFSTP